MVPSVAFRRYTDSAGSSPSVVTAVVVLVCFLCWAGSLPAATTHHKKRDTKVQVESMEEQWRAAQLTGDTSTMDRMLADDFIGISMSGQVNTKAQQLDRVRSRKLVITRIELSDRKVKLLGTVAVVTCQAEVEGTNDGVSVKGTYRYTRVYQQLPSGDWKITSFEATRIQPSKAARDRQRAPSGPGAATVLEPRFG